MAEIIASKKRARDDLVSEEDVESNSPDSPEAKRIRDDLLEILDDSEVVADRSEETQDLASVMKSFEEEILSIPPSTEQVFVSDVISDSGESNPSDSGESQPDLGYLFEASDDELGLPPPLDVKQKQQQQEEENEERFVSNEFENQIWRFEDEIPSYEFGIEEDNNNNDTEFLALDGLFDYSDVYSGQSDYSDFLYQPESLPAI